MSCGVGHRCGSYLALLRLWCRRSCSSGSAPSLGTSKCRRCSPKKQNEAQVQSALGPAGGAQSTALKEKAAYSGAGEAAKRPARGVCRGSRGGRGGRPRPSSVFLLGCLCSSLRPRRAWSPFLFCPSLSSSSQPFPVLCSVTQEVTLSALVPRWAVGVGEGPEAAPARLKEDARADSPGRVRAGPGFFSA